MNKYTVRIDLSREEADVKRVKHSIENAILRAHTPVLLRFGETRIENDDLLIEIASDAKRDRLFSLLQKLEQKTAFRIRELGWGWILSEQLHQALPAKHPLTFEDDPYGGSKAQEAPLKEYHCSLQFKIKFFASLVILGLFVLYVVLILVNGPMRIYLIQNNRYLSIFFWTVWMILTVTSVSLFPLIPWRYASAIVCDPESLTVKFFYKSSTMGLLWNQIIGLNISYNSLAIHTDGRRIKVMMGPDWCKKEEQATLIKTILVKAQLNHVEGGTNGSVYKRFDAA